MRRYDVNIHNHIEAYNNGGKHIEFIQYNAPKGIPSTKAEYKIFILERIKKMIVSCKPKYIKDTVLVYDEWLEVMGYEVDEDSYFSHYKEYEKYLDKFQEMEELL